MKPFRGELHDWKLVFCPPDTSIVPECPNGVLVAFGYYGEKGRRKLRKTSAIMNWNIGASEIETLNSRYKLVGVGKVQPY